MIMEIKKATIFTSPTCPFCVLAKSFLRDKGVDFEERDIFEDIEARQEVEDLTGQNGVPVISIDGDIVVGFNRTLLESLVTEN